MCKHALLKSITFSAILVAGLAADDPVFARPYVSSLTFHPVPLATVADERQPGTAKNFRADAPPAVSFVRISPWEASQRRQASIARYETSLAALKASKGPYDAAIGEQAMALGLLLQSAGRQEEALAILERSMHVLRVNEGLFSPAQVPVMKAIITSHVELRDIGSAHAMQEALLNLQRKQLGEGDDQLALVPALLEWADWNVNLYLLQGSRHAALLSGAPAQLSSAMHDPRLNVAYTSYSEALQILERNMDEPDERLVTTERKLAALNFMINRELEDTYGAVAGYMEQDPDYNSPGHVLARANSALFYAGSSALRRAIDHSANVPEPNYDEVAARMMELGDWHLLFDRRAAALDIYEEALEVMQAASLPQEAVERIMTPGMPVPTPDTNLLSSDDSTQYAGFIDVQFELSRFGMAMNPQIIASSGATRHVEKELLRTIRDCKFRPKFVAGSAANDQKIQLRYYYSL